MLEEAHGPVKTFRHAYTQRIHTIRKRAEPSRAEQNKSIHRFALFINCSIMASSSSSLTTSTSSSSLLVCVFSPDVLSNDDLHNCCSALFLFLFILSHTPSISVLKDEFHIQTFQICDSQIMGKTSLSKYATTTPPTITTYNTNIQTNINNFFSHLLSTSYGIYPNQKAVSRHSREIQRQSAVSLLPLLLLTTQNHLTCDTRKIRVEILESVDVDGRWRRKSTDW